jgi:oxalate decarboxylase/phosphoglucose isomerase-like protein (cupin superfamily)
LFPKQHSVTNAGAEDLIFLVIYDPRTPTARL